MRFLSAAHEGLADANAGRISEDDEVKEFLDAEFGSCEPAKGTGVARGFRWDS
jgi:predicted transcriptional regulator